PSFRSELLTVAAGPFANIILASAMGPLVWAAPEFRSCFHPVLLPPVSLTTDPGPTLALLMFSLNIKLIYLNLLPVYPMDGGRMVQIVLSQWWDGTAVRVLSYWVAMISAMIIGLVGYAVDPGIGIVLVTLAFFILI